VKHPSQVIILAEDRRQQNLFRRFLLRCGVRSGQMRFSPLSAGKGCGEQWVRAAYPKEVQACRSRNAGASTGLIVIIDADNNPLERRKD